VPFIFRDVKIKPQGVKSDAVQPGGRALAETHQNIGVTWHTDAAFENPPPQFIGWHVLCQDQLGGGSLRILPITNILSSLASSDIDVLKTYPYRILTDPAFYRGPKFLDTPLIATSVGADGKAKDTIRFSIHHYLQTPPEDEAAKRALRALRSVIGQSGVGFDLPKDAFQVSSSKTL
jgi:hypothetical protein